MQFMKNVRYLLVLSAWVAIATPAAWASGNVSLVGSADFLGTKQGSTTVKAQTGMGGGLLYEMGGGKGGVGLEIGGLYTSRKLATSPGQTLTFVEIPVVLRYHLGPVLSIGGG